MKPFPKKHIARLQRLVARQADKEKFLQAEFGAERKGTIRVADNLDAASIQAALDWIAAQQGGAA